jgi:hypothetical protein
MRPTSVRITVLLVASLGFVGAVALAAQDVQDRSTLKVPNEGLTFSDFKGYNSWQDVAVSETKTSLKAILANDILIQAYKEGIPGNGKPFPEGSKIANIEWLKKVNSKFPYFVEVPDTLKSLSFIEKDPRRFPKTHGWAYAQFVNDPATQTLRPSVSGAECGYACHTVLAAQDYFFTAYPPR